MESSDDENYDDEDEEEKVAKKPNITRAPELVDVDIGISAFANARKYPLLFVIQHNKKE